MVFLDPRPLPGPRPEGIDDHDESELQELFGTSRRLIAFGCGWLAGSLIQSSRKERELARQAKDRLEKQVQPMAQQVTKAASEVADNLRVPAQQAVESIKSVGRDAASTVTAESRAAMDQVSDRAEQAKRNVGDRATDYPARQR